MLAGRGWRAGGRRARRASRAARGLLTSPRTPGGAGVGASQNLLQKPVLGQQVTQEALLEKGIGARTFHAPGKTNCPGPSLPEPPNTISDSASAQTTTSRGASRSRARLPGHPRPPLPGNSLTSSG